MRRLHIIAICIGLSLVALAAQAPHRNKPAAQQAPRTAARYGHAAAAIRAVAEGLQDVGQVGADRSGE
jgi:hypothetical protein